MVRFQQKQAGVYHQGREFISVYWQPVYQKFQQFKKHLLVLTILMMTIFAGFKPYQFADLWLTKDQQGQLLFSFKKYDLASQRFVNSRWKAYSYYGNEQYQQAATLYSQFVQPVDLLAQANALAHHKSYVQARALYRDILVDFPEFEPAQHNLAIIEGIIESINLMSESQKPEQGDSPKELGDEPQRADGAEKKEARKQSNKQLSAEELLNNPQLSDMWLRQVQKNPAQFLGIKFQLEYEEKYRNKGED